MIAVRHCKHVVPMPRIVISDLSIGAADAREPGNVHAGQTIVEVFPDVRIVLALHAGNSELLREVLLPELSEKSADQSIETYSKLIHDAWTQNVGIAQRGVAADRLEVDRAVIWKGGSRIDLIGILPGEARKN